MAIGQRFGGALNLNVHVHALVLDGVFARDTDGPPRFHAAPDLTAADAADVLAAIVPAVRRLLARRGCDDDDDGDGRIEGPPDAFRGAYLAAVGRGWRAEVQSEPRSFGRTALRMSVSRPR